MVTPSFRPLASRAFRPVAVAPLRSAAFPALKRGFAQDAKEAAAQGAAKAAEGAKQAKESSSNVPLILSLLGVGGLGVWYSQGGFGPAKSNGVAAPSGPGALDPQNFKEFTLKEIRPYNHDSSTFIFELPDNLHSGMRVASAVVVKGAGEGVKDKNGKDVIRPYTPITAPEVTGHVDFLVKKYAEGAMTNHIHSLKPGDKLAIKGPIDKYQYKANEFEQIAMVAGGSGITPMWQLIDAIAKNPADKTQATLIYTNKSDKDILLRERFDELASKDPRFKVVYGLDKISGNSPAGAFEGYVTPEILSKHFPAPAKADKIKLFVCGPPAQVEVISGGKGPKGSQGDLKGLLADLGYQPDQVYKF